MNIPNSENFLNQFPVVSGDDRIFWRDQSGVTGMTILRPYPDNIKFKSAVTRDGKKDTVVMIKIGFYHNRVVENSVLLIVSATKASKYLLGDHFRYVFDDPLSPTEDSLKLSDKSPQPINLTDNTRFSYNLNTHEFFDLEKNKKVTATEIVNFIYNLHVDTLSLRGYLFLKLRILLRDSSVKIVTAFLLFFWDSLSFLGKRINPITEERIPIDRTNFHFWFRQNKYTQNDLISLTENSEVGLLGSSYKISVRVAVLVAVLVLSFFVADYNLLCKPALFRFFERYSDNEVFLASIFLILYFCINNVVPYFIIKFINVFLRLKKSLLNMKFNFG